MPPGRQVSDKRDRRGSATLRGASCATAGIGNRSTSRKRSLGKRRRAFARLPPQSDQQSTDFVPTWFDVAGAEIPKGYHLDGISFAPLFKNPDKPYRDYVF
jgi:hypothetical protein